MALAYCDLQHFSGNARLVFPTMDYLWRYMNIYVGNLAYEVNSSDLEQLFADFGSVESAKVITDMGSGRSKGFGFVEMDSADDSKRAIDELNGQELKGRPIVVNEARPKKDGGGGGGDRRGDGGGGGGGGRSRSGPRY